MPDYTDITSLLARVYEMNGDYGRALELRVEDVQRCPRDSRKITDLALCRFARSAGTGDRDLLHEALRLQWKAVLMRP